MNCNFCETYGKEQYIVNTTKPLQKCAGNVCCIELYKRRQACASSGLGSGVCVRDAQGLALDNVPCRPLCFVAVKIRVITLSPVKTPLCENKDRSAACGLRPQRYNPAAGKRSTCFQLNQGRVLFFDIKAAFVCLIFLVRF